MRQIEVDNIEYELLHLINNKQEDIIWCLHEKPLVFKSRLEQLNKQSCVDNNITICNSFNFGGTIVADQNDISFAIMKQNGWNVGVELLNLFKEKLSSIVTNLNIVGNDLLYENKYKILSYASINTGDGFIYTAFHASFNPNLELIQQICTKRMCKVPMGLDMLGVTQKDILDIVKSYKMEK